MIWFLGSLAILLCIAASMVLTGSLILFLAGGFAKKTAAWRMSAADLALSALTGTAFWVFLSGSLSYLGLTFNQMRPWTLTLLAILLTWFFLLYTRKRICLPAGSITTWVLAAGLLAGAVSLLPLALKNTFLLTGDPFTYVSIADFLQAHNFSMPIQSNPLFPGFEEARIYQQLNIRMGENFLLALSTSWLAPLRSVYVYPGVLAWGIMLNVFGLFLWMRWGLKSSNFLSILPLFFLALTSNPVQTSAVGGFFPQTFGTAYLLLSLSLLSRLLSQTVIPSKTALLWGASVAALVSMYSELFPVLALASLVSILLNLPRFIQKARIQNLFKAIFVAACGGLLCANYEWLRMLRALPGQINAVVGWQISLNFLDLWGNAIGAKPFNLGWNVLFAILAVVLSLLLLPGIPILFRKKQFVPLSILGIWGAMGLAFWLGKGTDPFKAAWSLYKITQWSFLSLIAAAFFSLRLLKFVNNKLLVAALALTCILGFIPLVSIFNIQGAATQDTTNSLNPIEDYFQLAQIIKNYDKSNVYQVSRAAPWPRQLPAYFLMRQPFLSGSWNGKPGTGSQQVQALKNAETLFYCLACPFPNSRNPLLPANAVVIQQPVISETSKDFIKPHQKNRIEILEEETVCLTIFSIQAGLTEIRLQSDPAHLLFTNNQDWHSEITNSDGNLKINIDFPTQKGYNLFCMQSNQAASITILDLLLRP